MSIIPATKEAEVGGLWCEASPGKKAQHLIWRKKEKPISKRTGAWLKWQSTCLANVEFKLQYWKKEKLPKWKVWCQRMALWHGLTPRFPPSSVHYLALCPWMERRLSAFLVYWHHLSEMILFIILDHYLQKLLPHALTSQNFASWSEKNEKNYSPIILRSHLALWGDNTDA
jgi:hypothetical protein